MLLTCSGHVRYVSSLTLAQPVHNAQFPSFMWQSIIIIDAHVDSVAVSLKLAVTLVVIFMPVHLLYKFYSFISPVDSELSKILQVCMLHTLINVLYSEYDKRAAVRSDLPAVVCVITGSSGNNQ